ncbi:MAG: hypothetical protein LBD75_02385 [Candidatus Peribacteria bacterium]|jgi:hypothetical protein|nr:hypothetical protein [Candidatus Peribacteria bacterium]
MNLKNNEPVGAIHEENFLEMFDVYVALKNDLEHGEHGELSKEARGPNDSKKEIKRNTKEIKKHFKRQKEINQLLAEQELLKIANDNENLLEKLLREMIDGKMDPAHQSYYQLLFHWIGQHASNYPLMWNSLIELTKVHPQFANQVGYTVRYSGDSRYGG